MSKVLKHYTNVFHKHQPEIERLLYTNLQWNTLISLYNNQILHFDSCENQQIRNDKQFMLKLIKKWPIDKNFFIKSSYLTPTQLNDREFAQILMKSFGYLLHDLNDEFKNDEKLVEMAVLQSGYNLQYASAELRNNYEIVMRAVRKNGLALEYASEELRNNMEIVSEAVSNNGMALQFASNELQANEKVVSLAVSNNGMSLQFADMNLCNNYGIVMKAVSQFGISFQFASDELRSNRKIAMKAIKTGPPFIPLGFYAPVLYLVLEHVGQDLINDRKFLLKALKYEGLWMQTWDSDSKYWNDPEIILACFKSKNPPFGFENLEISEELRNNLKFMKTLLKQSNGIIRDSYFDGILPKKASKKDIPKAPSRKNESIDWEAIREDKNLIKEVFKRDSFMPTKLLSNISEKLRDDKEFIMEMISITPFIFDYASDRLKSDREFVKTLISKDGFVLRYASDEIRKDKDLTLFAIQNGLPFGSVHENLVTNLEIISEILLDK